MTPPNTHIVEPLRHLATDIRGLMPDPANARKHNTRNLEAIADSLRIFGQRTPIVVQISGDARIIRKGNGTTQAARMLAEAGHHEWWQIAVVEVNEDGMQAAAYAIADNRTGELAEWDDDVLAQVLSELRDADDDELFEATGFADEELETLLVDLSLEFEPVDDLAALDEVEGNKKTVCPECSHVF